jgi:hypothetical protein
MQVNHSPDDIRSALDEILPGVQKPTRYLGIERNLVRKPWDEVDVRVELAFPDAYEIGMSHQRTRILYHLINRRDDALTERTFAPMPDMDAALRGAGLSLYTLESYRVVADFDIVGISLQSELNYINIPYLLDLSGITRRAADRQQSEPIVIGGGPCTANPEPVADFFDAILIGDGEAAMDEILDTVRDGRGNEIGRDEILSRLAAVAGVYVPGLYRWHEAEDARPARWETIHDAAPFPVKRRHPGPPRDGNHAGLHPGVPFLPGGLLVPASARARPEGGARPDAAAGCRDRFRRGRFAQPFNCRLLASRAVGLQPGPVPA